jgi:hypothetical protein
MAKKKSSSVRWFKVLLVLALLYAATFLVWSRLRSFRVRGDNRTMWSFFQAPSGFQLALPNNWRKWKERERIAATIFWPCIQLDERWTNRRYWPAIAAEPSRLVT